MEAMSLGAGVGSVWIGVGAPGIDEEGIVSVLGIVGSYYDAWISGRGDFSTVPLAPDFAFTGPVASFDSADGFREMAAQAGPMVTRFSVRRQFADGDTVCSIIDWEMALPVAAMTAAEILQVRDGRIVRGELIYDAQELRAATAAGA
jgi:ketosteroid isomerase-like protein